MIQGERGAEPIHGDPLPSSVSQFLTQSPTRYEVPPPVHSPVASRSQSWPRPRLPSKNKCTQARCSRTITPPIVKRLLGPPPIHFPPSSSPIQISHPNPPLLQSALSQYHTLLPSRTQPREYLLPISHCPLAPSTTAIHAQHHPFLFSTSPYFRSLCLDLQLRNRFFTSRYRGCDPLLSFELWRAPLSSLTRSSITQLHPESFPANKSLTRPDHHINTSLSTFQKPPQVCFTIPLGRL